MRKGNTVSQKIVRHIGVAADDEEKEKLKLLTESIRLKLEAQQQMFLFSPEELAKSNLEVGARRQQEREEDYKVDIRNLEEEQRVVSGIHDVYVKLFHELGYERVIKNLFRNRLGRSMIS